MEEAGESHLACLHCGCIPDPRIHHRTQINNTWEPNGQRGKQTPTSPFSTKLCLIRPFTYKQHCNCQWHRSGHGGATAPKSETEICLHPRQLAMWINTISLHIKHNKQEFASHDTFPCCITVGIGVGIVWSLSVVIPKALLTAHTPVSAVHIFFSMQNN